MPRNVERIVLAALTAAKVKQGLSSDAAAAWAAEHLKAGVACAERTLSEANGAAEAGGLAIAALTEWAQATA